MTPRSALLALGVAALLCAVGLLLYLPLFSPIPVIDDGTVVIEHPAVRDGYWLTAPFYAGTDPPLYRPLWRPLATLTYHWNWLLSGAEKESFALVSLLLLIASSFLVYLWLRRVGQGLRAALFAAGLLLLHPVNAESVLRLAGRSELLSHFFLLAALLMYTSALRPRIFGERPPSGLVWRGMVTGIFFLLALLGHERALVFPIILIGYEITIGAAAGSASGAPRPAPAPLSAENPSRSRGDLPVRRLVLCAAILLVVVCLWAAAREGVLRGWPPEIRNNPAPDYLAALSSAERVNLGLSLPALYARLLLGLEGVLPNYAHLLARPPEAPPVILGEPSSFGVRIPGTGEVAGGVTVLLVAALIFAVLRRRLPLLAFGGWLLVLGLLAPLPLLSSNGHVASARHLFLPLLGLSLILIAAARQIAQRVPEHSRLAARWGIRLFVLVVLLFAAIGTRTVGQTWTTHDDVLQRLVDKAPLSPEVPLQRGALALSRARSARARGLEDQSRELLETAAAQYEEAIGLFPRMPRALLNLGLIRAEQGQSSLAGRALSDATVVASRLFPHTALEARAYVALGHLLGQQGQDDAAAEAFRRAVQADSTNVQALARAGMMNVLTAQHAREGIRQLNCALSRDPSGRILGPLADRLREMKARAELYLGLAGEDAAAYEEALEESRGESSDGSELE